MIRGIEANEADLSSNSAFMAWLASAAEAYMGGTSGACEYLIGVNSPLLDM